MSPTKEQCRRMGDPDGIEEVCSSELSLPEPVVERLSQLAVRFVQDSIAAGRPAVWLRRAQALEDARPRPGDFTGRATAADLAAQDARLAESARLCRLHAAFLAENPEPLTAFEHEIVAGLLLGEGAAA